MKYYLTFIAIFKGEHAWLEEWLRYHEQLGVEHFYLYCNDHGDERVRSRILLEPYVKRGLVTLRYEDEVEYISRQVSLGEETAAEFATETRWMGFFDLDEFVLPTKTDDIRTLLENYEDYDALAITWSVFGSGGHVQSPPSQINHFHYRARSNRYCNRVIKSFAQPKYMTYGRSPNNHYYVTTRTPTVDPHYRIVDSAEAAESTEDIARLNHYMVRSRDWFFRVKSQRCEYAKLDRDIHNWYVMDLNEVYDDEISRRFGHVVRHLEKKDSGNDRRGG